MKVTANASGVLALAALAVGGALAWKAYKAGGSLLAGAKQAAAQAGADVQSAVVNNVTAPFLQGWDWAHGVDPVQSTKAWLYGDYAYTGIDPATGQSVADGEFFGDPLARSYAAGQFASGAAPPAQSSNGAAFGIYPGAPQPVNAVSGNWDN